MILAIYTICEINTVLKCISAYCMSHVFCACQSSYFQVFALEID